MTEPRTWTIKMHAWENLLVASGPSVAEEVIAVEGSALLTRQEAKALLATNREEHADLYGMGDAWRSGTTKLQAIAQGGVCPECHGEGQVELAGYSINPCSGVLVPDPQEVVDVPCPRCGR